MILQNHEIQKLLNSSELCSILEPEILSRLSEICKIKHYTKNELIYSKGEKVTNFLMLISGECELIDSSKKSIRMFNRFK